MRTVFIESREELEEVIKACKTCYVAMCEGQSPYVLPMNFALDGNYIILHSAPHGRMWDTIKKNPKLCINWTLGEELAWQDVEVGCSYRVKSKSVNIEGEAEFVDDYDEKERLLKVFMGQYSDREFKFNAPAVRNVGIMKVKIENISGKVFGAKPDLPWKH